MVKGDLGTRLCGNRIRPKVLIPRGLGTNSHEELKEIFELAGANVDYIKWNDLIKNPDILDKYQGLGLAGGFAMGDLPYAGQSLANRIKFSKFYGKLDEKLKDTNFPVYSTCNCLQLLAKLDLFPMGVGTTNNDSGKHETQSWDLEVNPNNDTVWVSKLKDYDSPIFAPISHGEGRIWMPDDDLQYVVDNDLVALRYTSGHMCDYYASSRNGRYNPNGSIDDIAGFGWNNNIVLFPHPERLLRDVQRPDRYEVKKEKGHTHDVFEPTLLMFRPAVELMEQHL